MSTAPTLVSPDTDARVGPGPQGGEATFLKPAAVSVCDLLSSFISFPSDLEGATLASGSISDSEKALQKSTSLFKSLQSSAKLGLRQALGLRGAGIWPRSGRAASWAGDQETQRWE